MNKADEGAFASIFVGLTEIYGKESSTVVQNIFWNALKDYDFDAVRGAFSAHVKSPDNGQFFPKPADIIRLIAGTSKDSAFISWSKVEQAVQRIGPYETVVFDDPIIHLVVADMGGWIMLGEKTSEEWPFIRNEFVTRYQGYKSSTRNIPHANKLVGITEATNRQRGYEIPDPVLIGNTEQAMAVLGGGTDKPRLEYSKANDLARKVGRFITE